MKTYSIFKRDGYHTGLCTLMYEDDTDLFETNTLAEAVDWYLIYVEKLTSSKSKEAHKLRKWMKEKVIPMYPEDYDPREEWGYIMVNLCDKRAVMVQKTFIYNYVDDQIDPNCTTEYGEDMEIPVEVTFSKAQIDRLGIALT